MGRKPSQVVNAEINRLRRILEENLDKSDQDIMLELGIKKTTFYRYKERIRQQDKETWLEMAKESMEERSAKIMKAIQFAEKGYKEIAYNPAADQRTRIEAFKQVIQANVWAMQLLERGPKIMPKLEAKLVESETSMESIREQTV